jgi:Mor family transcriptional regulator
VVTKALHICGVMVLIAGGKTSIFSDKTQPVLTRLDKNIFVQTRGNSSFLILSKPYKISKKSTKVNLQR